MLLLVLVHALRPLVAVEVLALVHAIRPLEALPALVALTLIQIGKSRTFLKLRKSRIGSSAHSRLSLAKLGHQAYEGQPTQGFLRHWLPSAACC